LAFGAVGGTANFGEFEMMYVVLAALLGGLAAGALGMHKVNEAELIRMADSIKQANSAAEIQLGQEMIKTQQAEAVSRDFNHELDTAHVQAVQTINAYAAGHAAFRLFDAGSRPGCGGAAPGGAGAGVSADAAAGAELSGGLAGFLEGQAALANQAAVYAADCRRYVVESNCGISKIFGADNE